MKNKYLLIIFAAILLFSNRQTNAQNTTQLWTKAGTEKTENLKKVHRSSHPKTFDLYKLNIDALKNRLANAPLRQAARTSTTIISFPMANGKLEKFSVFESPIMHPDLAAKFPMIKTYAAQGIDDPTATMRFSITQFGLHTMTLSGKHSAHYIDPYSKNGDYYMVYDRKSLQDDDSWMDFECLTEEGYHIDPSSTSQLDRNDTNDQKLRTYRLAQTCTAEYGNIFAGTGTDAQKKANIQAQMTITINRVNEIYERDLAITLEFIANNDLLIYYGDVNADPWNGEYNTKTQEVISTTLDDESLYDIGHNFNTSGGGNAGCLSCVCIDAAPPYTADSKGRGMTGRSDPTGDPFDIDYVAHEMGHQFGGYHTMNTCSRSGNGMTEVEPASGSSIMGYAGICPTNVQMNSDAHFNYVNIRDISANVQPGGNSTCGAQTNLANNPPTADAGNDYTIPKRTAYVLEGTATDPDGMASLTYNWSENDPEQSPGSAEPQSSYAVGPLYRAILPTTSPKRYLPKLSDVLAGNLTPTWEVTPSVARTLDFSFIVRDNFAGGGQTAADLMTVTVDGTAGPFTVSSQSTAAAWNAGDNQTITWDVAGTNSGAVNTPNVDIFLIIDDGASIVPVVSNVANNGSYTISVPTGYTTNNARVMVKGHNNIFYAVSTGTISIQDSEFVMNFTTTGIDSCVPDDATYTFTYNTFNGFNETTTFSATGNPAGSTVSFSPSQATTDGTSVTVTVSGITSSMLGNHTINVVGTSNSDTKNVDVSLQIYNDSFDMISLTSPTNTAAGIISPVTLDWTAISNTQNYTVQVATDMAFTNIVENASVSTNSYQTGVLNVNTEYFWRVMPTNLCGSGNYSSVFSFTTANIACNTIAATDVPQNIGPNGGTITNSVINFTDDLSISEVIVSINLTHTWDSDLDITLTAPDGTTTIDLSTANGSSGDNYTDTVFDDDAAQSITAGSAPFTGTFQPEQPLSTFDGLSSSGDWTLSITDNANGDGGQLISWSISICGGVTVGVNDYLVSRLVKLYPNPTSGLLHINNQEQVDIHIYDVLGKQLESSSLETGTNSIDLSYFTAGIYFVKVRLFSNGQEGVKTYRIIKQ